MSRKKRLGRFCVTHIGLLVTWVFAAGAALVGDAAPAVLHPDQYRHYVSRFMQQEVAATSRAPGDPWPWMIENIPWFESSNKQFEEMFYFRWYAFQKHVVKASPGYLITEWLPKVAKDGAFGVLCDAAPHHIREARWLRDRAIVEDYARYWMSPAAAPRKYSFAVADAVHAITTATGDNRLGLELLPALIDNYRAWERQNLDPNGLYFQIDTRDAMEKSISGSGYRPTLNSYMYGDALAIAGFAGGAKHPQEEREFRAKAEALRTKIEADLWNPKDEFYEGLVPRGDTPQLANVRELLGYLPWYFDEPPQEHAAAWRQLTDVQGFAGRYGPTTAERRCPRFRFPNPDKCQWNGPSWPFATTQTLIALANLLNRQEQNYVTSEDYYRLFSEYVRSQRLRLANGDVIPWIDEDLDADTDEWIARDILISRHSELAGRGNYYNHSGFADPLITGLVGLRPRDDNKIVLHPLLPARQWSYFALDGLPYHGHVLTVIYDETGKQYHRGRGLLLLVDGRTAASRPTLGELTYELPAIKAN